ncbi:YaaR family protein [Geomesophilobacter sediminis]|uniref:YaaR family protein n=1 Tax=Geomesophilobacter sediminis TaxID=2798584 RepID=A0A8J7M0W1_9BACT|nr:YaaR family protein [Geomesophilobacter sediminis]MBJ6726575.1 YaaR family protein [Geomesophilobacter sediminis]
MRIDEKKDAGGITRKQKKEKAQGTGSVTGALFAGRLNQARQSGDYPEELQRLKGELDEIGEILEREPTVANYRRFRDTIGALARKVNAEAYRVEQLGGTIGRVHEVISVIDKEADVLYHLVMREQKDNIRIAAQIMKIRGLIVDFIL